MFTGGVSFSSPNARMSSLNCCLCRVWGCGSHFPTHPLDSLYCLGSSLRKIVTEITEGLPRPSWKLDDRYCIQEWSPLVPILSHINPMHTLVLSFILILLSLQLVGLSSLFLRSLFSSYNILCIFRLQCVLRVDCQSRNLFYFLILISEKCGSYEAPHFVRVSILLLHTGTLPIVLFWNLMSVTKFQTHTKHAVEQSMRFKRRKNSLNLSFVSTTNSYRLLLNTDPFYTVCTFPMNSCVASGDE